MNQPRTHHYRIVDVFTDRPLEGNPLAVFLDGAGIDDKTMQDIAREMNLSETTFILPATRPACDARVRIFTPAREMLFAGHPTIGTSYVLLQEGIVPRESERFVLEEKVGPVPIRVERVTGNESPLIWLTTPPISEGKTFERSRCAAALGLDAKDLLDFAPQLLSAGNPTLYIPLRDSAAVDRAWLDSRGAADLQQGDDPFCVFVFTPVAAGAYSRMFAPRLGVVEDPATGSSTGPLAAYMLKHGLVPFAAGTRFVSEQGTKMKRRSILHVKLNGEKGCDGIEVGGHVAPLSEAVMRL
jgi:trans-2,3-dihydro-3-hydroxyanthranilate isomerase